MRQGAMWPPTLRPGTRAAGRRWRPEPPKLLRPARCAGGPAERGCVRLEGAGGVQRAGLLVTEAPQTKFFIFKIDP